MDQITESDILAGSKKLSLPTRSGQNVLVTIRALSWRKLLLLASESDLGKRNLQTIEDAVPPYDLPSLDLITPDAIGQLLIAINLLTNGVPTLKKNQAAAEALFPVGRASPRAESPPTPTSSTPNPPSSNVDINPDFYVRGRPQNSASHSAAPTNAPPAETYASSPSPATPVQT
jgi:hypothetical protein